MSRGNFVQNDKNVRSLFFNMLPVFLVVVDFIKQAIHSFTGCVIDAFVKVNSGESNFVVTL